MNPRLFLLLLVLLSTMVPFSGCASSTGGVSVRSAGDETVASGVLAAVRARWPNADLGTPTPMMCPGATAAPVSVVRGDFNGDNHEDVALGVDDNGVSRLVAAFARLDGEYSVREIGDAVLATPVTLSVMRRGSQYELAAAVAVDFYFGTDTVISSACDGQRTAWTWMGDSFLPLRLAN